MSTLKTFLAGTFFLLLFLQGRGQTIDLKMDAHGVPTIVVNGKTEATRSKVTLPVAANKVITFTYSGTGGQPVISLKGTTDAGTGGAGLDLEGFQNTLTTKAPLVTDAKLNIPVGTKTYSLNQPFVISFASAQTQKAVLVTITPKMAGSGGAKTVKANKAGKGTAAADDGSTDPNNNNNNAKSKLPGVYHPGSPVYDALKLTVSTNVSEDELKAIIKFYYPDTGVIVENKGDAIKAIQGNPFLKQVINDQYSGNLRQPLEGESQAADQTTSGLSLSSISGLDVTTVADGIAKFLVKRAKQELSVTFFQKLKVAIRDQKDLSTLFPKTAALLENIDTQIYNYSSYLQNLQSAFKVDVAALDTNLPGILQVHKEFFTENKMLAGAIITGSYLTTELKKQAHPGDIVANFPMDAIQNFDNNTTWTGTLQTLQLLSESFRDTTSTDNTYWVNLKYLREVANNKVSLKLFLGLLYQQAINNYNNIPFGLDEKKNAISLVTVLNNVAAQFDTSYSIYTAYKQYVMQFAVKTDAINKMIQSYQKPANDSLAVEIYKQYFDAATDLFSYSLQVTKLPMMKDAFPDISTFTVNYNNYLKVAQSVSDLAIAINRRDYSGTINQAAAIFTLVDTLRTGNQFIDKATVQNLVRYGSFMASLAVAKTSDDAEAAVEAFAMPAGSSSVKRESPFNVALNAYVGLFTGHESITDVKSTQLINAYGLTAPIGVSISWGTKKYFPPFGGNGHSSYSLFLSLVDVGAVAAFRFKDNVTASVPSISLKDIVSPGLFFSYGFAKTPLSLNLGAQMGPNLRQVNDNSATPPSNDYANKIYWRYSVGLVVDIPILNLYTKSK